MKRMILYLCLLVYSFLLYSCETTHHIEKNASIIPHNWSTIAILPFSGERAFARASAELFSFHIRKQEHFKIIQPAIAEITLLKKGLHISQELVGVHEAQEAGHLLGAEAVIIGNIKIHYGFELHAIADLKLIDTKTGDIVATIALSSPLIFARNEHDFVIAAIEEVSKEILLILEDLSGKIAGQVK